MSDVFKSWYSGRMGSKNEVGILVDRDLRELVVEVKRVSGRLMSIKLIVGFFTLNVIIAYVPQVGLDKEVKRLFWEDLDGVVCGILHTEKLFIGGDFDGHIRRHLGVTMMCMEALQPGFMEVVQESWNTQVEGNAMWRIKTKLQTLARNLSKWSRASIGDIYEQFNNWEVKVQRLEELDFHHNLEERREELNKAHAE
ncbi:PREDICTED: uncharacterized protein LOC109214116 [Nicotiana attenuata]|uniref:uncharacterized protein LOC109214116 n=1 Tax=Nicotiana attenuata TaxID=49451 RepID=UPI0009049672|nr:PREDICTED: uncharacterized protein LOC109214116 [Nicotiana attenuata]